MATCQPFREGRQHEQRPPLQLGGCVLPAAYRGMALRQNCSVSPPAAPEPSSSTGRSATEARALKIHSEAERRRRERINAHLATMRRMIPDTKQMDKATLLASVVNQLNDLKRKASEATQTTPIPAETNSITVDCYTGATIERTVYIQATISCDDRPGLLADLAAAFRGLRLGALRADMASLGGRTQCSFVLCKEDGDLKNLMSEGVKALEDAVRQALAMAAFSETVHGCSGSRSERHRFWSHLSHVLYSDMNR